MREWDSCRKRCEKKEISDLLDVLASLEDEAGQPLLSFEEIKAQIVVRSISVQSFSVV
jgi:hypothetical protein